MQLFTFLWRQISLAVEITSESLEHTLHRLKAANIMLAVMRSNKRTSRSSKLKPKEKKRKSFVLFKNRSRLLKGS